MGVLARNFFARFAALQDSSELVSGGEPVFEELNLVNCELLSAKEIRVILGHLRKTHSK